MKARLAGEDWSGLETELKEFTRLTPRDQFAQRLTQLKDDAAHRQAELKTPILTKTAQAQITELQSMIDRYMDDEAFNAYSAALEKNNSDQAAAAKVQAKKKSAAPRLAPPVGEKTNVPAAPPPSSATPAQVPGASAPGRGRPQGKAAPPSPSTTPF